MLLRYLKFLSHLFKLFKQCFHSRNVSIMHQISFRLKLMYRLFHGVFYLLRYIASRTFLLSFSEVMEMERLIFFWRSKIFRRTDSWTNYRSWFPSADAIDFSGTAVIPSVLGNFAERMVHRHPQYARHAPKSVIKIRYVRNCIFVPQVFEKYEQHAYKFYFNDYSNTL